MPNKRPRRDTARKSKLSSQKTKPPTEASVLSVARESFGFEQLRPGQGEGIRSLLSKRDTLVVMPTGSGKSAIYQITGLLMPGSVLVVSPLIALQKDQVDSINVSNGTAAACVINSSLKPAELRESLQRVSEGGYKFIFLAPEQLHKEEALEALKQARVSMIVIDEAHCISEWGHDFRPDYLRIGRAVELLGHPVILAMTATASERVRKEIIDRLEMKKPYVFAGGFDRPNIYLRVDHFDEQNKKLEAVIHQVRWAEKPGIVYVATRKAAEQIMHSLQKEGIQALFYHGGLKGSEREEIQDRFMSGDAEVIIATNAFGMGIDKANIRFVYHHDAPDSLDSYYQEIGRAGRDGERADAILFFRKEDIGSQAFHTGRGNIDRERLNQVTEAIAEEDQPVTPQQVAEKTNLSTRTLTSTIQKLEEANAVEVLLSGEIQLSKKNDLEEAADTVAERQEERKEANKERLEEMRAYADTSDCRREHLLRYFGDTFTGPCHNCDNCEAEHPGIDVDPRVGVRREVTAA
jgi:ATP-dependent DNA helicase RecQ